MRVLGVIPARFGSSRFPGKPLANLGGRPLVLHVLGNARGARRLDRLGVATDDERIAAVVREAGGEAWMTPSDLPSGSDRVARVAGELEAVEGRFDVVVNIQGDEPFLPGSAVDRAVEEMAGAGTAAVATLAVPCGGDSWEDPNVVKVVFGESGRALYFSRSPIPHGSGDGRDRWRHLGLYAFRRAYLERFVGLPVGRLERVERLEQLRALEDGAEVRVVCGDWPAFGVDTPEDLERANDRLRTG